GFPQITLFSPMRGATIRMYPAEVDRFDGFSGHINQASCTQSESDKGDLIYDTYVTKGAEIEVWHPRFCYHGYRYVEVVAPATIELTSKNFAGYLLRTNVAKNGTFTCSDEVLNRINTLTERSIESNMMSTFTDCPQIEKLGWSETPSLMFYSMAHTYDINAWTLKLFRDMRDAQYENGRIAAIAPEYFKIRGLYEDLNWNGSIIFTAWQHYESYGDAEGFSDENYAAMKRYVAYLEREIAQDDLIFTGQMGEWGEMTKYGKTPVVLVETTAYYRLAVIMQKIADVRGNAADSKHYRELSQAIKIAFHQNEECYNAQYLYGNGTQSGYGCVLYSGIAKEEDRKEALNRLVAAIAAADYHLTSGEVGLKQVFSALGENGRSDIIYRMVTNDTMPSYKYFVDKGLTTLPEYWNFEDLWGTVARSRNHAMMGHVKEWFTKYLAGISMAEHCYTKVNIKPSVIKELTSARGTVDTVHGPITSAWEYDRAAGIFHLHLVIPVGVTANIYLPMSDKAQIVGSGEYTFQVPITM
nr:family 78 glycoside hydrolase catalytic domain [Clostridiales bacterium]